MDSLREIISRRRSDALPRAGRLLSASGRRVSLRRPRVGRLAARADTPSSEVRLPELGRHTMKPHLTLNLPAEEPSESPVSNNPAIPLVRNVGLVEPVILAKSIP